MEEITQQVLAGGKLAEETRVALQQINAATQQVNQLVEVFANAAVEHSHTSQAVTNIMSC